jgi:branched-chain amino acid transport system permease protein
MDLFLQQLSNGLVVGSTYAVVAVGFALAFTVLRVIQFAHPDVFMIGMFSGMMAAGIVPGGGLAVALIGGAVGSTAIGAVIERMVVAPLRGRDVLTTLIATLVVLPRPVRGAALAGQLLRARHPHRPRHARDCGAAGRRRRVRR